MHSLKKDAAKPLATNIPNALKTMMLSGVISAFDFHFSNCLVRLVGDKRVEADELETIRIFAALVSNASFSKQHACLNLDELDIKSFLENLDEESSDQTIHSRNLPADPDSPENHDLEKWTNVAKTVAMPNLVEREVFSSARKSLLDFLDAMGNASDIISKLAKKIPELICEISDLGQSASFAPLVWRRPRLYLHRFWGYENEIVARFAKRAKAPDDSIPQLCEIRKTSKYFETPDGEAQLRAVELALRKRLSIITGGPGTGKTAIASAILALHLAQNADAKIALCAPTGKAQARLAEAIREEMHGKNDKDKTKSPGINCSEAVKEKILSLKPSTIHRLLNYSPSRRKYLRDSENPLDLGLIIVDEASMAPLSQMASLLRALPENAKIVLLGDADQLASVETGAVLADLCDEKSGLKGNIAKLEISHRFPQGGAIDNLKNAINKGDSVEVLRILRSPQYADLICWRETIALDCSNKKGKKSESGMLEELEKALGLIVEQKWSEYLEAKTPEEAFLNFNKFQILCSHRGTPFGADSINRIVRKIMGKTREYAKGLPLMITKNDYGLGLFNGDIGICWTKNDSESGREAPRVYFPATTESSQKFKDFAPGMLPEHECAYAITVHKAQGSGFDEILFIIPDIPQSPILTREMLYTGITRTRKAATIWASKNCLVNATVNKTLRPSGIREKMAFRIAELQA